MRIAWVESTASSRHRRAWCLYRRVVASSIFMQAFVSMLAFIFMLAFVSMQAFIFVLAFVSMQAFMSNTASRFVSLPERLLGPELGTFGIVFQ